MHLEYKYFEGQFQHSKQVPCGLNYLCLFVKYQLAQLVCIYFWVAYTLALNYTSILVTIACCFDYCNFIVRLKVMNCEYYNFAVNLLLVFWLFQVFLLSTVTLDQLVNIQKIACWILIGAAWNIKIQLEGVDILVELILLIHKQRITLDVFIFLFILLTFYTFLHMNSIYFLLDLYLNT